MNKKVTLTLKELKRIHMMHEIQAGRMTAKGAAEMLGLSERQVRRLIKRQREGGDAALAHGNRGRSSARRLDTGMRERIVDLAKGKYRDYNDCHFQEELAELPEPIQVSRSTLRTIRRAEGVPSPRKRRAPRHRARRERKPQAGMLLQADGSRHDWLEGRGPWLSLLAYLDDATGEVAWAGFREEEDAAGYFLGLRAICLSHGIPGAIYADRHTIFQTPAAASLEQELAGEQPRSQLGRLLAELGIELIAAHSPQAKGRIERLWETFQDRLVKALREAAASNAAEANRVLESFLPKFNARFRVAPAQPGRAYLPWPADYHSEQFFCFKHTRIVTQDNTIPFDGHRLQIPPGSGRKSYAKARVDVWQHLDGCLEVRYQGESLVRFRPATDAPLRVGKFTPAPGQTWTQPPAAPKTKLHTPHRPADDHPWRQYGQSLKSLKGRRLG
jgi:transposase